MMTSGGVVPGGMCRRMVCDNRGGLRQRRLNVRAGLKEDFDDRDAVQRLRLDVLDVVDQGGDGALASWR